MIFSGTVSSSSKKLSVKFEQAIIFQRNTKITKILYETDDIAVCGHIFQWRCLFMSLLSLIFTCCSGDGVPPAFPAAAVSSALPAPARLPLWLHRSGGLIPFPGSQGCFGLMLTFLPYVLLRLSRTQWRWKWHQQFCHTWQWHCHSFCIWLALGLCLWRRAAAGRVSTSGGHIGSCKLSAHERGGESMQETTAETRASGWGRQHPLWREHWCKEGSRDRDGRWGWWWSWACVGSRSLKSCHHGSTTLNSIHNSREESVGVCEVCIEDWRGAICGTSSDSSEPGPRWHHAARHGCPSSAPR